MLYIGQISKHHTFYSIPKNSSCLVKGSAAFAKHGQNPKDICKPRQKGFILLTNRSDLVKILHH